MIEAQITAVKNHSWDDYGKDEVIDQDIDEGTEKNEFRAQLGFN